MTLLSATASDASQAGQLVGYALDAHRYPGADETYADLLRRYRLDSAFQEVVDSFCSGLGLTVLAAADQGLMLTPDSDSVFAMTTVNDFETGLNPQQRVVYGLVMLCIASTAYPLEGDLERVGVIRIKISRIERVARETVRTILDAMLLDEEDPDENELLLAIRVLDAMPTISPSGVTRRSRSNSLGLITAVFDSLVEQGQARLVGAKTSDGDTEYQLLERFRLNVQEAALPAAHAALREKFAATALSTMKEEVAQ
jgi:hypothetical protein